MNRRTLARFERLCTRGLPPPQAVVALLDELHRVLPSEFNRLGFAANDRIVAAYCEDPGCYVHLARYFTEIDGKVDYWPSVAACLRRGPGVGYYLPYQTRRYFSSPYYHDIERPLGSHHQLDAVIGDGARVYGSMILSRRAGRPFAAEDLRLLQRLLPWIAHALAVPWHSEQVTADPWPLPESGVLLVDERAAVQHADAIALRNLHLLADARIGGTAETGARFAKRLVDRLASLERGEEGPPPSCVRDNAWGRFRLHAQRMHGATGVPTLVQIRIDYAAPRVVALRRLLGSLQLSPRLREVCEGLVDGRRQAEMARELDLSPATINEYVQQVYARFGVNDRPALLQALLDRHGALLAESGPARRHHPMP